MAALRYCSQPGCAELVESGRCANHRLQLEHARTNLEIRRLYRTKRWAALKQAKRTDQPFCFDCLKLGRYELWTDLDHIVPHRGDLERFWDPQNVQGLCASHHSAKTKRGE